MRIELTHKGFAHIPQTDWACERALESYRRYEAQMDATFKELAEERSTDKETHSCIVREIWKLFRASSHHV